MAVEDNPHRYLDREIRYFDEQAAAQKRLGWGRPIFGWQQAKIEDHVSSVDGAINGRNGSVRGGVAELKYCD